MALLRLDNGRTKLLLEHFGLGGFKNDGAKNISNEQ